MSEKWKVKYPCGCQFDGHDLGDPAPEHCPSHGEPKRLLGFPMIEIPGCPSCKRADDVEEMANAMFKESFGLEGEASKLHFRDEWENCLCYARAARKFIRGKP
jgi:hypothetical protein